VFESSLSGLDTIVVACVSALGGFFGAYIKKGAEIQSMSDNIQELANQQKRITEATEQVKQDIEHQVWRRKELELVRRQKMEEFASLCLALPQQLTDEYIKRVHDVNADYDRHSFKKFMLIQRLYLPSFASNIVELIKLHERYDNLITDIQKNGKQSSKYFQQRVPDFHAIRNEFELFSARVVSKAGDEIEKMGHS
jgi:hypothetical protein